MKHILILVLFLCLVGCKKEDNRQYSSWYINTDTITTNNVELLIGKGSIVLGSHDANSFAIVFHFGYVTSPPMSHDWYISHTALQDPDSVGIVFYRGAKAYNISPSNENALNASEVNGKARYVLPPGYFRNVENYNDSILAGGTFNQP